MTGIRTRLDSVEGQLTMLREVPIQIAEIRVRVSEIGRRLREQGEAIETHSREETDILRKIHARNGG